MSAALLVKICGVRRPGDVRAALNAGADLVGLNFAARSLRCLGLEVATRLAALLPDGVGVGVFEDAPADLILDTCRATGLGAAQVHGALSVADAARPPASLRLIVAHRGTADRSRLEALAPYAWAFLLDGAVPGSGEAWAADAPLGPRLHGRPTFLAGGLRPDTVAAAIAAHGPGGVDVASGVEGADRQISAPRVAAFVTAARAADAPEGARTSARSSTPSTTGASL